MRAVHLIRYLTGGPLKSCGITIILSCAKRIIRTNDLVGRHYFEVIRLALAGNESVKTLHRVVKVCQRHPYFVLTALIRRVREGK